MRTMPVWLIFTCRVALIALIPVVLVLTNVRLLMTHTFPDIEYSLPGFPDDTYGISKADRLKYSKLSIDYLLNNEGIEWLAALRFPEGVVAPPESCPAYLDGDCNRFYNDRELQHMLDVKIVTTWALRVWAVAGVLCLLSVGLLYYAGQKASLRGALLSGSGLTVATPEPPPHSIAPASALPRSAAAGASRVRLSESVRRRASKRDASLSLFTTVIGMAGSCCIV